MKKLYKILISFLFIALASSSSAYASNCYRAQEAEAEQGIRIHSELMVIGLGCQHMATANGKNLYLAYREFTKKHEELFATYERIIMKYYRASGQSSAQAEKKLNDLRTAFANKISTDQANMRPDIFCKQYSPRITKVVDFGHEDLRRWAATIYPSHPVSKPLCDGQLEQ